MHKNLSSGSSSSSLSKKTENFQIHFQGFPETAELPELLEPDCQLAQRLPLTRWPRISRPVRTRMGRTDEMSNFDPDLGRTGFARHLFRLRFRRLKVSQRQFAERFGLSYSVIRDAEQGARPTPLLRLVVAAIARDPEWMEATARMAQAVCQCGATDGYEPCIDRDDTAGR